MTAGLRPSRRSSAAEAPFTLGEPPPRVLGRLDQLGLWGNLGVNLLGTVAFGVLAVRELDQSFADTHSTAVSVQNLRPRWDRRVLAAAVGAIATIGALAFDISDNESFLILIGSLFVPLLGILVIDYFVVCRGRWDLSEQARPRWRNLAAWALGFIAFQLVNPGAVPWWSAMWGHVDGAVGFTSPSWLGASPFAFVVAALVAWLLSGLTRRGGHPRAAVGAADATIRDHRGWNAPSDTDTTAT